VVLLTEKQQRDLLIIAGLGDFLVGGALTKAAKKAVVAVLKKGVTLAAPHVTRGAVRAPGTVAGAAAGVARVGKFLAMRHPVLTGAAVVYVAYKEREQIKNLLDQGYDIVSDVVSIPSVAIPDPGIPSFRPGPAAFALPKGAFKRKKTRANMAVKQAMKLLKGGTKAQTGSKPGTLPKGAFKIAVKAAGLANPKTKSIIGKGKSKVKALARRLKKWW
jgi:hypothetical protein